MPFVSSCPVNILILPSSIARYQFAVGNPYDTEMSVLALPSYLAWV